MVFAEFGVSIGLSNKFDGAVGTPSGFWPRPASIAPVRGVPNGPESVALCGACCAANINTQRAVSSVYIVYKRLEVRALIQRRSGLFKLSMRCPTVTATTIGTVR